MAFEREEFPPHRWRCEVASQVFRALLLRVAVVTITTLVEGAGCGINGPTYTDIDYLVISDAGALLISGHSPYERTTFRYTPVLALIASLNQMVHPVAAKLFFCCCDGAVGLMMALAMKRSPESLRVVCWGWLFNPVVVNLSTRGSADSLPCALVVGMLCAALSAGKRLAAAQPLVDRGAVKSEATKKRGRSVERRVHASSKSRSQSRSKPDGNTSLEQSSPTIPMILGATAHGLAVHVKLYPVIYFPPVLAFLYRCSTKKRRQNNDGIDNCSIPVVEWDALIPVVKWVLIAALAFCVATLSVMVLSSTRQEFLERAILYHFGRADHRHNYSIWWYAFYLLYDDEGDGAHAPTTWSEPWACRKFLGIAALVPVASFLLLAVRGTIFCEPTNEASIMVISLSFCLFVSTAVFVHAGKVLTAQYFLWYLALLPLAWPAIFTVSKISPKALQSFAQQPEEISSEEGDKTQRRPHKSGKTGTTTSASRSEREMQSKESDHRSNVKNPLSAPTHHRYYHLVRLLFLWITSMILWLGVAYMLEFQGWDVFSELWIASLAFFATSSLVLREMVDLSNAAASFTIL